MAEQPLCLPAVPLCDKSSTQWLLVPPAQTGYLDGGESSPYHHCSVDILHEHGGNGGVEMAAVSSPQTRGFLFADLRDYTRFAEEHGDAAAADILRRYRLIVREVIARHDGAEIRTEGDGFYVVFRSVSMAVQAGLAILEGAAEASVDAAPIRPGIGINAGETADTEEGIVSTAVNVAARVCALAPPGELLVTDTVRALTRTYLDVRFLPRGAKRLKNIAEPIELFRVVPPMAPDAPVPRRWTKPFGRITAARRPSGGLLLVAVVAVFGVAALAAYVRLASSVGGEQERSPAAISTGTNRPNSTAPSASTSQGGLTSLESNLVAHLPADVAPHCRHASPAEGALTDAVGSVVCHLPAGEPADTVWFDLMDTANAANLTVASLPGTEGLPAGDCSATVSRASGTWTVGALSGLRLCYQDEETVDSWIMWTYDDPPWLARAVRSDLGWAGLFNWWRSVGPYLAVDPEGRN